MKPTTFYPFTLFCLLLLAFVLPGCTPKSGAWKNEQIDPGKREDFHELNDKVFSAAKANDLIRAKLFMSKELIENTYTRRSVEIAGNHLNDNNYKLLDEYYVVNKYKDADTIKLNKRGINSYSLTYPGTAREMYIAFYVPTHGDKKYMITTIYAKYDYGWKLNDLDLNPYTINGKTAPELYKLAKEQY